MSMGQNTPDAAPIGYLRVDGAEVACALQPGTAPALVFLPGYGSTAFGGQKAEALAAHCAERGRAYLRFDYPGHGRSSGDFKAGTLGAWLDAALAVVDAFAGPRYLLCGSSMGGWLMLHVALRRPAQVAGLIGVAAAPDFTASLPAKLDAAALAGLARDGVTDLPSSHAGPLPLTRRFLDEAERHALLNRPIPIAAPVHLLHGVQDPDVPWRTALKLAARLASRAVTVELVEDGDHRLSRPGDLARLMAAVARVPTGVGDERAGDDAP